jgi:hypothetical protein
MTLQFDVPSPEQAAERARRRNAWMQKKWPLLADQFDQATPDQIIAGVETANRRWQEHEASMLARIADEQDAIQEIAGVELFEQLKAALPDYARGKLAYEADYWWHAVKQHCPEIAHLLCTFCSIPANRQWYIKNKKPCLVCKHDWSDAPMDFDPRPKFGDQGHRRKRRR